MSQASELIAQQFINGGVVPADLVGQSAASKTYVDNQNAIQDTNISAAASAAGAAQSDINQHKISTTAHPAQNITYNGKITGATNVKTGLDSLKTTIDQLTTSGDSSPAADAARYSTPQDKTYPSLKDRLDASDVQLAEKANKGSLVFSVKDYGAKGDWNGTTGTDDTASIQATVAAAQAVGGGCVYFPHGNYRITSKIIVDSSNIQIAGSGIGATELVNDGGGDAIYVGDDMYQVRQITIRDMTITANGYSGGAGIVMMVVVRSVIENVQIAKHLHCINFQQDVFDIWCSKLHLLDLTTWGSAIYCDAGLYGGGIWVSDSTIDCGENGGTNGIQLISATGCFYTNIDIRGAKNDGLFINALDGKSLQSHWFTNVLGDTSASIGIHIRAMGTGITSALFFNNCWSSWCDNVGILFDGDGTVSGIDFTEVKVQYNGNQGIYVRNGRNISFIGGYVTANSRNSPNSNAGIVFDSGISDFKIIGVAVGKWGELINTQGVGIAVEGSSNNFMIANCYLRGNAFAGINDTSTGTNKVVVNNLT